VTVAQGVMADVEGGDEPGSQRKGGGGSRALGPKAAPGPWSTPVSAFLVLVWLIAGAVVGGSDHRPTDLSAYPWLFLREDHPLSSSEELVEVMLVGDVMLGRGLAEGPSPFTGVRPWLRAADLTLGNLECVITADPAGGDPAEGAGPPGSARPEPLTAPPKAVGMLRRAGFDLLGLANNHTLDLGLEGLKETRSRLSAAGMTGLGGGPDVDSEMRAVYRDVRGVRLAFLAFNAVPDGRIPVGESISRGAWDADLARAAVGRAADEADAVVVSIHWGYEYDTRADPAQRRAADLLLEAGADLVIGHHPHVIQEFVTQKDRCVAYSLGNFVFDQGWGRTGHGLALRALFDEDGLRGVQGLPVRAGLRPSLLEPGKAAEIVPPPQGGTNHRAFSCTESSCAPTEAVDWGEGRLPSGVFWGGRVDLTGDGYAEHVRRVGGRVIIYSQGEEVWRSPDAWRVEDVAPGDPNDDGRRELVLALWKPGLDGLEPASEWKEHTPRSRPFIIGYRGGVYRTLWGGSAVANPIHEVALGDVDGDGAEELLVLEAPESWSSQRRIGVWRWHGWGFSLVWRSEPGWFSDLVVDASGTVHVAVD